METKNSWGLYDKPSFVEMADIPPLAEETLDAQLAAGALVLSMDEAVAAGFVTREDEK